MRVLVTGAAGFIGSHMTRFLVRQGHAVWASVLPGESLHRLSDLLHSVALAPADLRDASAVRALAADARPDCAIHLAWYAVPGKYWNAPENLECVSMSLALARALAEAGCGRFVGAGSCAEYAWDSGRLSEESTPLRPKTLYGICKDATRRILEASCAQGPMRLAWTRFFFLYGPGEPTTRLVPSLTLALLNGRTARCTGADQMRDFLYVEDLVAAVWAVAQSDLAGPVNIGAGQPLKIRAIVETLAKLIGGKGDLSFELPPAGAREPRELVADVTKLRAHTGWAPRWSLEAGLRQAIDWWQQHPPEIPSEP